MSEIERESSPSRLFPFSPGHSSSGRIAGWEGTRHGLLLAGNICWRAPSLAARLRRTERCTCSAAAVSRYETYLMVAGWMTDAMYVVGGDRGYVSINYGLITSTNYSRQPQNELRLKSCCNQRVRTDRHDGNDLASSVPLLGDPRRSLPIYPTVTRVG